MPLDIVRFPDPVVAVITFLTSQNIDASAEIPTQPGEHVLITAVSYPLNLVTRRTTYTLECRADTDIRAGWLGSEVASLLDAWCRSDDTPATPFDWELVSLVDSYPDPDSTRPRSIVIGQASWTGTSNT